MTWTWNGGHWKCGKASAWDVFARMKFAAPTSGGIGQAWWCWYDVVVRVDWAMMPTRVFDACRHLGADFCSVSPIHVDGYCIDMLDSLFPLLLTCTNTFHWTTICWWELNRMTARHVHTWMSLLYGLLNYHSKYSPSVATPRSPLVSSHLLLECIHYDTKLRYKFESSLLYFVTRCKERSWNILANCMKHILCSWPRHSLLPIPVSNSWPSDSLNIDRRILFHCVPSKLHLCAVFLHSVSSHQW